MSEPWLHAASPAGISLTTPQLRHLAQGEHLILTCGQNTTIVTGKSLLASITEKLSLFVYNAGIKMFASKGKVEIQVQSDEMALTAQKDVHVSSTQGKVHINAEKELLLQLTQFYEEPFMKINFFWENDGSFKGPNVKTDVFAKDNIDILQALLTDDGGLSRSSYIKIVDDGIKGIESVKNGELEKFDWDRECWSAEIKRNGVKLVSLYDESYFFIISFNDFEKALKGWKDFILNR